MTPPKPRGKHIKGLTPEIGVDEAARLAMDVRLRDVARLLGDASGASSGDPKAIHRLRVSTRRAAAALRVFKAWAPRRERRRVQGQLREIRRTAGEARMCDVQLEQFRALMGEASASLRPAIGVVVGRMIESRVRAGAEVRALGERRECGVAALGRTRQALLDSIGAPKSKAARDPADASASLGELAADQFPAIVGDMREAGKADLTIVEHVHALRIVGKRVRYAAEIFESCFDPEAHDELLRRLTDFQDHLGEMNDLWEMGGRVERYAGDASAQGDLAEALGRLRSELSDRFDGAHRAFLEWWGAHGIDAILAGLDLPGLRRTESGDASPNGAPRVPPARGTDRLIERTTPYAG